MRRFWMAVLLSVGTVTVLTGGPFFVFLLYKTRFIGGRSM